MGEYRELPVDDIHVSATIPNPRGEVPDDKEFEDNVRQHGIIQPIVVRPNEAGFSLIAGERRWRAAKANGFGTIPALIFNVDDGTAVELAIIENLHRRGLPPIREAESFQRLIESGRTIDEIAARLDKGKKYIYRSLTLLRLIPKVRALVDADILPVTYGFELAGVPADRQETALAQCFPPLFRDEPRREHLEPLANLTAWIEKFVRLDPRSEDTTVLLPELAEQVATAEQERHTSVLLVSTLKVRTDKTDRRVLLAQSWKRAEGKDACRHARDAVIVLGEGRSTFLRVCVEKKRCARHWPRPGAPSNEEALAKAKGEVTRLEAKEQLRQQQEEQTRWERELCPRALRWIAASAATIAWSQALLKLTLQEFRAADHQEFTKLVGKTDRLPIERYPQAIVVALALRSRWQRDDLIAFARRLRIPLDLDTLDEAAVEALEKSTTAKVAAKATANGASEKRRSAKKRPKR